MRVKITAKASRYADYIALLDDESKARLLTAAKKVVGDYWDLTLGELIALSEGNLACKVKDPKDPTLAEWSWMDGLPEWLDGFVKSINNLTPKQTADEQAAAKNCLPTSWSEGLLIFARNYFGLPSFDAAESIKVGELLIAKKDRYNEVMMARGMAEVQKAKMRKK